MRDRQRCRQWVRMGNDDTSCCNRKMISQNNWVIPPTVNFLYLTCGVVTQYHITSHHVWNSQLKPCVPVPVKLWFDLHFMSLQKMAKLCKSSLALDFPPSPNNVKCVDCWSWKCSAVSALSESIFFVMSEERWHSPVECLTPQEKNLWASEGNRAVRP